MIEQKLKAYFKIQEEEFQKTFKNSLKEISYDDANDEYMTELSHPSLNYDKVVVKYDALNNKNSSKSIDGLFIENNRKVFVEFKNGRLISDKQVNKNKILKIKKKIKDSNLILCDMLGEKEDFIKTNIDFVLVYSEIKNPKGSEHSDDNVDFNPSSWREKIGRRFLGLGKKELIRFGLGEYEGNVYKKVHTYTITEFEEFIIMDKL